MSDSNMKWEIRPGDPEKTGVTRVADGYNFSLETSKTQGISLVFYKKGSDEICREIPLLPEYRTGTVWSVWIRHPRLTSMEYGYRLEDRLICDPSAPLVYGTPAFGVLPEGGDTLRGGVLKEDRKTPLASAIPYEEMIIYKVHVRGYTMHRNSRVRKKGTFHGLQEKIPYLKNLGVTTLELMPAYEFREFPERKERTALYLQEEPAAAQVNYWGFAPGYYYAPKRAYSSGKDPEKEMKDLVAALHEAGMECLMDFYFPESLRSDQVSSILRFWRKEYGIDGFVLLGPGAHTEVLADDPILADTKLLAEGWDTGRIYKGKHPGFRRLGEYHCGFQNAMRRFLKGDEDQINSFQYYVNQNPPACGAIHFIANHDGFTLADLVSYEYRHNEANKEDNRDGTSYNYSWNCGAEGATRRPAILELRKRQMRNAILLVLLSQGTPLIYGGDELGNSQDGNNNAYCQDNEIGWTDWGKSRKWAAFTAFVEKAIRFRKEHPILHRPQELRPTDYLSLGWPEISFHSQRAWFVNRENTSREIGVLYCGAYAQGNEQEKDAFLYVIYNMHWTEHPFALPDLPEKQQWYLAVDTGREDEQAILDKGEEIPVMEKKSLTVGPRRILVLIGKQG